MDINSYILWGEKLKKHVILITAFFITILFLNQLINACTVFHVSNENLAFGGNNEDWTDSDTYIYFVPPNEDEYGRVIVGYAGNYWIQGGMNEKGLFWDGLAAPYLEVMNSSDKPYFNGHIVDYILRECDTCDEAINIFNQYNMKIFERAQLLIGDQYGDSFIIEGDVIHKKTEYFQVATNFYLSQWGPPYPCWRYNTAVNMFESNQIEELSVDFCVSVLDAVHQEGAYPTQYSTLYDLKKGLVYLYHNYNYNKVKIFNLTEEFELGYHSYYIPDLFENDNLPPLTPSQPSGSKSGKIGEEYHYSSNTYDPDGDKVYYLIDWGDDNFSEWIGPYDSGDGFSVGYSWGHDGTYNVKVKAKDEHDSESDWSDPLPVSMPLKHQALLERIMEWILQIFGIAISNPFPSSFPFFILPKLPLYPMF